MKRWSNIRKKLETEYLAKSLQGHIQYYATSYSKSPDHVGRAAIRYDGKEILKGCYWNNYMNPEMAYIDDTALKLGVFDQCCFYTAFAEFDNQSIEASLQSDDLLIRIFAVLDRRIGKRRLELMKESISTEPETFQTFYVIRAKAEGLLPTIN